VYGSIHKCTDLSDASRCDVFYDDCVTQLKEVLQVTWQTTKLVCLHHRDQASSKLKVSSPSIESGPDGHVGNSRGGVVTE
jgi:hypothetical protein